MTAMEDRKKFTYRYDNETEKLLTAGLEKFNLSSLNKLIDKLIVDALVRFPQEQKTMKQEIKDLQDIFKKCQVEKELIISGNVYNDSGVNCTIQKGINL
jgi:predicted transcriptional regulator